MRVLVVEDDLQLARQIASALTEAGHDPITVNDGERALDKTKEKPFDLVVLDIVLPGMDGFDVLRHLRSQHIASRVLMLTARGEVKDRVTGLQLGADDYLPKPFAMRELVARVNALGRRYPEEPVLNLSVGDLTLDLVNHHVHRGPRRIVLAAGRRWPEMKRSKTSKEVGFLLFKLFFCENAFFEERSKLLDML